MDPYKFLHLSPNPDGSLTRLNQFPTCPATSEPAAPVLSKDLPLNPDRNTWLRLHLPHHHLRSPLPVLLHFHGGGFIFFSAATSFFHAACDRMASAAPALVASVEYRLAPEHPLPAAFDDAVDALRWLRAQALSPSPDPWLARADFSRCFLVGSSAGATIVYHAAIRALAIDLAPVRIAGLIFNQPYFGGEDRTESELRFENDKVIPLPASDLIWKLSLPEGADRDHEFSNPMKHMRKGGVVLPRCLVRGYLGDPLVDRQRQFVAMLEGIAEGVVGKMELEGHHGIEIYDKSKADELVEDIREFVASCSSAGASASAL